MPRVLIWVVVPVYEREDSLNSLIACLKRQTFNNYSLIVVDHGKKRIRLKDQDNNIEVIRGNPKMWWTAAVNHGIRYVLNKKPVNKQTSILILNDDVTFGLDYLSILIDDWNYREDVILGSLCLDKKTKKIIRANMEFDRSKARVNYKHKGKNLNFVSSQYLLPSDVLTGRGTLIPIKIFLDVGLYNEKLLPHYRADYELIFRAKKKGFVVLVSTRAVVYSKIESQYILKSNIKSKINYLINRKSTANIKDIFFYSYLCFDFKYGTYFFLKNLRYIMKRIKSVSESDSLNNVK